MARLLGDAIEGSRGPWAALLEALSASAEGSAALRAHVGPLCALLSGALSRTPAEDDELPWLSSCLQALSAALPSWAACRSASADVDLCRLRQLQVTLEVLLDEPPRFSVLLSQRRLWKT